MFWMIEMLATKGSSFVPCETQTQSYVGYIAIPFNFHIWFSK